MERAFLWVAGLTREAALIRIRPSFEGEISSSTYVIPLAETQNLRSLWSLGDEYLNATNNPATEEWEGRKRRYRGYMKD
jgi:hypothetical protein